jgi:hypothetical protein
VKAQIIALAMAVKQYATFLRVLGGIFFCLSLVAGIFWLAGKDVEPVTFLLSLISSVFFASPSVAEWIAPARKPVYRMNCAELLDLVSATDPRRDWKRINTSWVEEVYLLEDPRLRFRCRHDEAGTHCDHFQEPWANRHPDPHATSYWYDLYYDSALIERFIIVSVDGGRALLPLPTQRIGQETRHSGVLRQHYHVAAILDSGGTLDDYMQRSRLIIAEPNKPSEDTR